MKHFEIQYLIGRTNMMYECTTAREAYGAVCDIVSSNVHLEVAVNMDGIMCDIADMLRGKTATAQYTDHLFIAYRDGEV